MLVIAVPSLIRLVCSPSASEQASESLFASVMKTPEKPASSAARDHSIRRAGGLSGRIVQASAVLAMANVPFVGVQATLSSTAGFRQAVCRAGPGPSGGRWTFSDIASTDNRIANDGAVFPGHIPNLEDEGR